MTTSAQGSPATIDISNESELQEWASKLDVSPQQILEAVEAVGNSAPDVELHLKGTRSTTQAEQVHEALQSPD